jgi:hypothetical protein
MLPGFRFLLAAIVLCISILVFGLGAAALLRAAHEEFAQNPSWRAAPEPRFAQAEETSRPVLAMLRIEPVAADAKTVTDVPANAIAPGGRVAPVEAAAPPSSAANEEKIAAPRVQETSLPIEAAKAEAPPADTPPSVDTAQPVPAADTGMAAVEQTTGAAGEQPAPAEPVIAPTAAAPQSSPATTRIATLGGPPVVVETETRKEVSEQDREEARKQLRAQRAKERRRLAARRARLAKQLAAQQAAADPFAQVMQQYPQPQLLQQTPVTQATQQTQVTQQTVAARRTR